jgi:hypothetical protein
VLRRKNLTHFSHKKIKDITDSESKHRAVLVCHVSSPSESHPRACEAQFARTRQCGAQRVNVARLDGGGQRGGVRLRSDGQSKKYASKIAR